MAPEVLRGPQISSLRIAGKTFPLYKGLNLIGRSKTATVVLKNENVSQHQAIISIIDENQHFISDVLSSNGTILDKNKLKPLELHELKQDSVIEFANIVAIYNKIPATLSDVSVSHHSVVGNLQSTQNVDDSFYMADTQDINDASIPSISDAHHNGYFDDGYDFNNLPSPPNVTVISPKKSDIPIHEMPTQLYGVINVRDIENEYEIAQSHRQPTIHDLPTQLMFGGIAANVSVGAESQTEEFLNDICTKAQNEQLQSTPISKSIHFEPTQIVNQVQDDDLNDTIIPQTQESPFLNISRQDHQDASVNVIDETAINDSGIETCNSKTTFQRNSSLTLVDATPCKAACKNIQESIPKKLASDTSEESQEISNKRKKCRPLESDSEGELQISEVCSIETLPSESVGYKKKPLRPIHSDSDTDVEDFEDNATIQKSVTEEIGKSTKKSRTIGSDSETDDEGVNNLVQNLSCETKKIPDSDKHEESSKIDSDSDTDIESEHTTDLKNKPEYSGSETDIEPEYSNNKVMDNLGGDNDEKSKTVDGKENESHQSDLSKDDTFFIPATQCSDDDSDDFNFMPENNISRNCNKVGGNLDILHKLNEQSVHLEKDSGESINLGLTDCESTEDVSNESTVLKLSTSTIVENNINETNTTEKQSNIYDDNTKQVDELQNDNNSNGNKNVECVSATKIISGPSDEIDERAIITVDNPLQETSYTDDIFMQPTQQFIADNDNSRRLVEENENILDQTPGKGDIYMQPTQKLDEDCKFIKPQIKSPGIEKSFNTSSNTNLNEDDIYLQATQQIFVDKMSAAADTFLKPSIEPLFQRTSTLPRSPDDDIFLQPTQELSAETQNTSNLVDIFLQPTQELPCKDQSVQSLQDTAIEPPPSLPRKPSLVINQNIFINPIDRNIHKRQTLSPNECDIHSQPTQALITENLSTSTPLPVTQECVQTSENNAENIFFQSTQQNISELADNINYPEESISATADNVPKLSNIFFQPTQVIQLVHTNNSPKPSLSLLRRQVPDDIIQDEEGESQLEVTFASQTVKLCSQINTRPSNPLANTLENNHDTELLENEATPNGDSENVFESANMKRYSEIETQPAEDMLKDFQLTNKSLVDQATNKCTELNQKDSEASVSITDTSKCTSSTTVENIIKEPTYGTRTRNGRNNINIKTDLYEKVNTAASKKVARTTGKEVSEGPQTKRRNLKTKTPKLNFNATSDLNTSLLSPISSTSKSNVDINNSKPGVSDCNQDASVKLTRITRKRGNTIEEKPVETNNMPVNTRSTRAKKVKVVQINEDSGVPERKRTKLEDIPETPKAYINITQRKGRKLDLDQQENPTITEVDKHKKPAEGSNKHKPVIMKDNNSIITISSSDSISSNEIYERPTTSKRRKHEDKTSSACKVVNQQATSGSKRVTTKIPIKEDTAVNGAIVTARRKPRTLETLNSSDNSTISTPERQKRQLKPKVVFTMLDSPEFESLIRRLGGTIVDTVKSCTVLLTGNLKRSLKLLSAVGEAKPICGPNWLHACKKAGIFVDPWDHLLVDKEAESKWNFSLTESLNRSTNRKLLTDYVFHIMTTTSTDVLKAAIESCGGKLVNRVPAKHTDKTIIIGAPENRTKFLKFLQQKPPLKVVAPEAIFDGVLRQELHWDHHLLS